MKTALIVIDMTNDFVHKHYVYNGKQYAGKLVAPLGVTIIPKIKKLIQKAIDKEWSILFLQDEHDEDTEEIFSGDWPEHCMIETPGAMTIKELIPDDLQRVKWITKDSYSVSDDYDDNSMVMFIDDRKIEKVYIVGLVEEVCVKANAMALHKYTRLKVNVIEGATVPFDVEKGKEALQYLKDNGIKFVKYFR